MAEEADRSRDILGRVYEYFLGGFAGAEGKRGGEFYTPRSVVRLLVEMLEPYKGRVYDPCCGSGGMFVQSERFVEEHGGRIGDIAIYGQESNYTTLAARQDEPCSTRDRRPTSAGTTRSSFHKDELPDLKADFILANPPFNVSDWGRRPAARGRALDLRRSARWQRQLRLATAHPSPPRPERDGGRGARQRLHVHRHLRRRRHTPAS